MPTPPADVDGTLVVVVLKARNLSDKRFYKQDVYTVVSLASKSDKTPVDVKGGQNPLWDHELRFLVPNKVSEQTRTLEIACWCKQSREDELIAKGKLDIGETLRTGEFDDWIPLVEPSGQQRGDIYLEMTFFSNATPPPAPLPKENTKPVHGPHYSAQISQDINAKLQRRPTKLLPAERLHRPPASLMPNRAQAQPQQTPFLAPASARNPQPAAQHSPPRAQPGYEGRSPSHSPPSGTSRLPLGCGRPQQQHAYSALPTVLPSVLLPGPNPTHTNSSFAGVTGQRRVSSEGAERRPLSTFPAPDFEHRANVQSSFQPGIPVPSTAPYSSGAPHPHPHSYSSSAFPGAHSSPSSWQPAHHLSGAVSPNPTTQAYFPVPAFNASSSTPPQAQQSSYNHSSLQVQARDASALPDPYLIARYQSPLPLPLGVSPSPSPASHTNIPQPAIFHTPPVSQTHGSSIVATRTPSSQYQSSTPEFPGAFPTATHNVDANRMETQRREEQLLRQKKDQEEKDMELARQLDMELNLHANP